VLLLIGTGLAAVAVVDALRAVRSQDLVADGVLRDYADVAAWSYGEHLNHALTAGAREALGALNHGRALHTNPEVPGPGALVYYLPWDPACLCHRPLLGPVPTAFFGFALGADTLGLALNQYGDPRTGWLYDPSIAAAHRADADKAYLPTDRAWLVDTLRRQIRSGYRSESGFTYVLADYGGHTRYIAYTVMPTVWGDTMVYGAEYAPAAFTAFVGGILDDAGLLPQTLTRPRSNRDLLAIEVVKADGNRVFAFGVPGKWHLPATTRLPVSLGALQIRAEVRSDMASQLVIGGLPRSHLPFLLVLLALASALAIVSVGQMRREGELGRLRAAFVANVSHELRTPLAQIRLDIDTIRFGRAASPAKQAAAFDRVDREAQRLTYLIENVLRFSRRDSRSRPFVQHRLDVAAETAQIVDEFRPLAEARRSAVHADVVGAPIAVFDREAMRQVLLNLLDNAVKYGPPRQTVRVGVRQDYGLVRVTVTDEGPGVRPEERELIWQAFRRGAGAIRGGVGGSGIGLTIVREVVEQHGGRAYVSDDAGPGATFVIELPLVADASRVADCRESLV
jgi:signal transduction histidine kinase